MVAVDYEILIQPKGGIQCGQYCVAMIVGTKPSYVAGRAKIYGVTKMYQWKNMLRQWGVKCADRAKPYKGIMPAKAMLRITYEGVKLGHAVFYNEGNVYCPDYGVFTLEQYLSRDPESKIKSFLEIY